MVSKDEVYIMINALYRQGLLKMAIEYDNSKQNYDVALLVADEYKMGIEELNKKNTKLEST